MADGENSTGPDVPAPVPVEGGERTPEDGNMSITFEVYRLNLDATSIEELQGDKLAEVEVEGGFVTGTDTVAAAKDRVLSLFDGLSKTDGASGALPALKVDEADRVTLFVGGRPMQEDRLFHADHFILLPAWVQVCLHRCDRDELTALMRKLIGVTVDGPE